MPAERGRVALVALAAALPGLLAWAVHGVVQTNDSPGYLAYADSLAAGPLPAGEALLRGGPQPHELFRTAGYPAVIAGLRALWPADPLAALAALQIAVQALLAAGAYAVGRRLGLPGWLAALAALAPMTGYTAFVQVAVMTDALYGGLATGAALLLLAAGVSGGRLGAVAVAGLLLGLATPIREATPYLALGLLPAAWFAAPRGRRWLAPLLLLAPIAAAAAAMAADHAARSGHAVLSTSRQVVMPQALLPLVRRGVPVFEGEALYDRLARETVVPRGYEGIDALNAALFAEGLSSPEIAAEASARYWRAWRQHPLEMLRGAMTRFPAKMLAIAFQPLDTAAEFVRQRGEPRPEFTRHDVLLRRAAEGSVGAALLFAALGVSRVVGTAIGLLAIAAPLFWRRDDPRFAPLLAAWLGVGSVVAVYLPVHLEIRYLVPVAPLLALLAATAVAALLSRRRAAGQPTG